jgi:hypothetical protein
MTATLANATTKNARRALDFYPTPPEVTEALMRFLNLPPSRIWEPACGDGVMAEVIKKFGHEVIASDIGRTPYGFGGLDFLKQEGKYDAVITNPPFNLSEKFIIHALHQAPLVAMLLKSQYWHAQKRAALFESTPPAWVLALTWRPDFMNGERGGTPTMECLWTVWMVSDTDTKYRLLHRQQRGLQL